MRRIDPKDIAPKDFHQHFLGAIAPRPIAFVSTVDEDGNPNLAPYSFFNAFSSNPPILVFSSNRRLRDNTTKDTLHNLQVNKEVVVNVVNYNIVRQMTVTSIEYPSEVSEFEKAGLTPIESELVKPYRVKESPVQMECKVRDIITLGEHGGAGHLIICDVLLMHIDENVMDESDRINPHKIDLMGRMGRAYYVRASGEAVYSIYQNILTPGIGFDNLPLSAKNSSVLTGNDLGCIAGLPAAPTAEEIADIKSKIAIDLTLDDAVNELHQQAREEIKNANFPTASALIWLADQL